MGLDKATLRTIHGDSVLELEKIKQPADLIYLDSYDFEDNNPIPSMTHHLKELVSSAHIRVLSPGILMAVDDNFGDGVGKGKFIAEWARETKKEIIHEGIQFVFKI